MGVDVGRGEARLDGGGAQDGGPRDRDRGRVGCGGARVANGIDGVVPVGGVVDRGAWGGGGDGDLDRGLVVARGLVRTSCRRPALPARVVGRTRGRG